jgi:hypothetical protein
LLDAAFGIVYYVVVLDLITTERFFQSIAAGLLGREQAIAGGTTTAALGVVLHLAIGCIWAAVYWAALALVPPLRRLAAGSAGALVAGVLFGAVIWLVMDFIVLPLSAASMVPIASPRFLIQLAAHALLVGPPIALVLRPRTARPDGAGAAETPIMRR